MAISKAQQKAVHNYVKKKYDRIEITALKGSKEYLQTIAAENGESVNAYIIGAINNRLTTEGHSELPTKSTSETEETTE